MELDINNKIEKGKEMNREVNSFINELSKSLEKVRFESKIENELYKKLPLASQYKNEFQRIVNECMKNISYEDDFFYFDYNKEKDMYYLDYYSDGEIQRVEIPKEDIKASKLKEGMFYDWYGKDRIVEARYMNESLAIDVKSELDTLNNKNRR